MKFNEFDAMETHFNNRTKKHINLVKKYAHLIESTYPTEFKGLDEQTAEHDKSKFEEPEYSPYLHIAWKYKMADEGKVYNPPPEILEQMNKATEHHVKSNKHHPEYFTDQVNTINPNNRDEPPKELVDATKMPILSVGEMVADWMAMAEEKGTNPKRWADKNVNIRWKFTDEQKKMIYDLISNIWGK